MDNALTIKHLSEARALIADKAKWIQGSYAVDNRGDSVTPVDASACAFCAVGALKCVIGMDARFGYRWPAELTHAVTLLSKAGIDLFALAVFDVNDKLGHDSTLRMFDKAIAKLEASIAA